MDCITRQRCIGQLVAGHYCDGASHSFRGNNQHVGIHRIYYKLRIRYILYNLPLIHDFRSISHTTDHRRFNPLAFVIYHNHITRVPSIRSKLRINIYFYWIVWNGDIHHFCIIRFRRYRK